MNRLIGTIFFGAALCISGCAVLPQQAAAPVVNAIPSSNQTFLGKLAEASQPDADLSGFRLMPSGDFSLSARLEFARRAEKSIDIQYYQIENDRIGRTMLRAVRDAALRGVRVRILVDDLYTSGEDELFVSLAATPNVELRLFNPFPAGRASFAQRFAASMMDFSRVNHRMHNKLFIADAALAVAGGRNLGEEYFGRSNTDNYVDLDTVVAGALVPRLEELFDTYWNSVYVRPVASVVSTDLTNQQLQERFETLTSAASTPIPDPPPPNDILGQSPIVEDLNSGKLDLIWAPAEAYADAPDRVIGRAVSYGGVPLMDVDSVRYNVIEEIRRAQLEVTVVSPYLIPGKVGLEEIGVLRDRGVKISLITNSLASTDEPLVYTAYRRYRPDLLRLGVDIWELGSVRSGNSLRLGIFGSRVGRLHAKSAVIDRSILFVGSMNFDPRSAEQNTELGLLIHSKELSEQQLKMLSLLKEQGAFRLRLEKSGDGVEWLSNGVDGQQVLHSDPNTGFWERAVPALLAPLMPESLL